MSWPRPGLNHRWSAVCIGPRSAGRGGRVGQGEDLAPGRLERFDLRPPEDVAVVADRSRENVVDPLVMDEASFEPGEDLVVRQPVGLAGLPPGPATVSRPAPLD